MRNAQSLRFVLKPAVKCCYCHGGSANCILFHRHVAVTFATVAATASAGISCHPMASQMLRNSSILLLRSICDAMGWQLMPLLQLLHHILSISTTTAVAAIETFTYTVSTTRSSNTSTTITAWFRYTRLTSTTATLHNIAINVGFCSWATHAVSKCNVTAVGPAK